MPVSDQIVTTKMLLQAQMELQQQGTHKTLEHLESTEPNLTEYVLEVSTDLYHQIFHTGASLCQARQIHSELQTLILVCLRAQQVGHQPLWPAIPLSTPGGTADAGEPRPKP